LSREIVRTITLLDYRFFFAEAQMMKREHSEVNKKKIMQWSAVIFALALFVLCFFKAPVISRTMGSNEKFCPIHHRSTQLGMVKISYGLIDYHSDQQFWSAKEKLFPLANFSALGGCEVGHDGIFKLVMYCPDCRQAQTDYIEHSRR
jgi:hypothetical protein